MKLLEAFAWQNVTNTLHPNKQVTLWAGMATVQDKTTFKLYLIDYLTAGITPSPRSLCNWLRVPTGELTSMAPSATFPALPQKIKH